MTTKLPVPESFIILPGDKSGLSSWLKVDGADGYIIEVYRTDAPDIRVKKIYAQNTRKNILGLKNGVEYFGRIYAFYYENGQEIDGLKSDPFYFTPISMVLTAQKMLCLTVGESAYLEWEYRNTIPEVSFSSDNTAIAVVCDDGEVTAYQEGTTEITIIADEIGEIFTTTVIVDRSINRDIVKKTTLMFTGDIMCPPKTQRMCSDGGYDFSPIFTQSIHDLFKTSDYTAGVLKSMCDDSCAYESEMFRLPSGTSNLNSPSTFIDALKDAGFNGLFTATNHNTDCGLTGIKATRHHIFHQNMNHIGSLGDNPVIRIINGIRIAFINLSQLSGGIDDEFSENPYVDLGRYSEDYFEELVEIAHQKRADQIIVMMQWGYKNSRLVTTKQRVTAQFLAEAGADVILGSGPHVMQAYEEFTTSDERIVPCLYSLGNFYSGMTELYENQIGAVAQITISEDSESYACRLSLVPTIITTQDSMTVVTTVDPVVTKAKQKAYDIFHHHYPKILFTSPSLNALSMQGSSNLSALTQYLDCTCDYSSPNINRLYEMRGEYVILDLLDFVDAPEREELLAEYISNLSDVYPGERVILLRLNFPAWGIFENKVDEADAVTDTNHILYDLEEYVIETIHPVIIDVSEYYFRNLKDVKHLTYEKGFYVHVARIIEKIMTGRSRHFYYNDTDYDIWMDRVINYHYNIQNTPEIRRIMINNYEAADIIISEKETAYIKKYKRQLLKLKKLHAELPFVEKVLKKDPDAKELIQYVAELLEENEDD